MIQQKARPVASSWQRRRRGIEGITRDLETRLQRHARRLRGFDQEVEDPAQVPVDASILAELRLDDFEPLLCALPRGFVAGAKGPGGPGNASPNLLSFVREVSDSAAGNPLLCELGERLETATEARAQAAD